jgi:hypothetical protein
LGEYEHRLVEWNQLRLENQNNSLEEALLSVNDWWQMLPIDLHYLHWDDVKRWPDPWDLLGDGIFCGLAKSLGIVYTLLLINRPDINDIQLVQTDQSDNLVLVNQGKYILNWAPRELLNKTTLQSNIARIMDSSAVHSKLN